MGCKRYDLDRCAALCNSTECLGFSYGKPLYPDRQNQDACCPVWAQPYGSGELIYEDTSYCNNDMLYPGYTEHEWVAYALLAPTTSKATAAPTQAAKPAAKQKTVSAQQEIWPNYPGYMKTADACFSPL